MTPGDWGDASALAITMGLGGDSDSDDPFLVMFNAWWEPLDFVVPETLRDLGWRIEIDTNEPSADGTAVDPTTAVTLVGRSLVLLHGTPSNPG
jgi:glycogen operon protein